MRWQQPGSPIPIVAGTIALLAMLGGPSLAADEGQGAVPDATVETERAPVAGPGPKPAGAPAGGKSGRPMTILQLGDSHTAADFFTGQIRRLLQAEFGDGGAGYVVPGRPRSGVRSSAMKIEASSGWTYAGLQAAKDAARAQFSLSGFEAATSLSGETLTYSFEQPIAWDLIEVETTTGPGAGGFSISLDGKLESGYRLDSPSQDRIVVRLMPEQAAVDRVREIKITTLSSDPVRISGVNVRNRKSGVSVSAIGFPGATVDIVNRFESNAFQAELKRMAPDVVVLAFGTNEGFNDNLDPSVYAGTYRKVIARIRRAAPDARLVVVSPPNANRLPANCKAEAARAVCRSALREPDPPVTGTVPPGEGDKDKACIWREPPKLARVRDIQRRIAEEMSLTYWNWASVMGAECGAHDWSKATPPLMADDHIHMTIAGYRQSAEKLVPVLRSVLGQIQGPRDAVPND